MFFCVRVVRNEFGHKLKAYNISVIMSKGAFTLCESELEVDIGNNYSVSYSAAKFSNGEWFKKNVRFLIRLRTVWMNPYFILHKYTGQPWV